MLSNYWTSVIVGIVILAAAIPYVMHIRHPKQKTFAAYLIFVSIFVATAVVLFSLLTYLAGEMGLSSALGKPVIAVIFLVLVFLPAGILATWQARKPPWRQEPPS